VKAREVGFEPVHHGLGVMYNKTSHDYTSKIYLSYGIRFSFTVPNQKLVSSKAYIK